MTRGLPEVGILGTFQVDKKKKKNPKAEERCTRKLDLFEKL